MEICADRCPPPPALKKKLQLVFETVLTERNGIPQFFSQLIITAIRQVSITRPVHGCELGVEIQSCAINARPRVLRGSQQSEYGKK